MNDEISLKLDRGYRMSHSELDSRSRKIERSDEERAAWNRYMRNFRRSFKERGLTSLSTVITTDQADFIEKYGRETACQSKREALMTIIDRFRDQYEGQDGAKKHV
ncbi:hypothetical protein FJU08_02855 [Martelella alba]|uniref:Uncharacterized protein n=1 Tax=Martelella alba TaxID=2590451 RepID=A0A506UJK8_9HYPH|nr:hypothetical protein [Martelella alba]TPW33514.1 hypothetical protein FJU08_02855 [Martelella alba]